MYISGQQLNKTLSAGVVGQKFCLVLDYRGRQDRHGSAFVILKVCMNNYQYYYAGKKKEHGSEHWHPI